ncbi:fumarylacetoacetate hydrolase family protein [Paeniglutamicibacter cryotolerans]|uniref:Fumarylacetoacetate (FAA) hydrolase family protein n=1 Tax=Paeniglutamicibacter cryotolerans TaxID=670079 RepID=A0A839QHR2_9MICC|nr:fumarylacetoacetate hydrolase family protein [Paeniglutamicibacter cryotolerans]MBB2995719.1 fumarylacetoacetate (FAA) hydrolase family protein [Paeniglutamicibacter cryotolerans]
MKKDTMEFSITDLLPLDAEKAVLIGRVFDPLVGGPCVVVVDGTQAVDISSVEPTVSTLLERDDLLAAVREDLSGRRWELQELLDATAAGDSSHAQLLAPIDLQAIKAAGVTFVESMLERVIEERAQGDSSKALAIRERLSAAIGGAISSVRPGSPEAAQVKEILQAEGLWSQYLEVGIGPDPEIFSKSQVLSAVGTGTDIGVLARSTWNNPEPEVVLAVRADGRAVGAALGNDVNLRDFEGRSALLLTEAKDNNRSCAIGPFIRLFDDSFSMDDVRELDIELTVSGPDGFSMDGTSSMKKISRDPQELIGHAHGKHHQYPDGFVLFTGTLFSPTQDRHAPGAGFTHEVGDVVSISNPKLGMLRNTVKHSEEAAPWTEGIWSFIQNLNSRGLL